MHHFPLVTVLLCVAGAHLVFGQAAPQTVVPKTVNEGVYVAEQAMRGQQVFESRCTMCHDTGRFTGADFLTPWAGKPLHELFEVVSKTMPEDNPGTLQPQEYVDVITYFLKLNGFPAASEELKAAADALRAITIEKKPRI